MSVVEGEQNLTEYSHRRQIFLKLKKENLYYSDHKAEVEIVSSFVTFWEHSRFYLFIYLFAVFVIWHEY